MRVAIYLALLLFASHNAVAKKPQSSATTVELTPADAARLSAYTPQPRYPLAARERHIAGSGIFRLEVQFQTGRVSVVQVKRSTGNAVLDAAAIEALRRWRLKPDAMRAYRDPHDPSAPLIVNVPIDFRM